MMCVVFLKVIVCGSAIIFKLKIALFENKVGVVKCTLRFFCSALHVENVKNDFIMNYSKNSMKVHMAINFMIWYGLFDSHAESQIS